MKRGGINGRNNTFYGSEHLAGFARIDLGQVLFVFTLYKILIGAEEKEKTDIGKLVKEMLLSPIIVAILISIGYDLVLKDIPWRETLKVTGLRLFIMAVFAVALIALFHILWPQENWDQAVWLMFLLPPPFVLPVFSQDEEQRVYISSVLSVSTLVTLIGFVVLAILK